MLIYALFQRSFYDELRRMCIFGVWVECPIDFVRFI